MDAAIVTGAAGTLGHAAVDEFLGRGHAVVALDRPSPALDASVAHATSKAAVVRVAQILADELRPQHSCGPDAAPISGATVPVYGDA